MKARIVTSLLLFTLLYSCQNIDDVSPAERDTQIHFYGGLGNFESKSIEVLDDGYLLLGDSLASNNGISRGIVVIKTDFEGRTIWRKLFADGSAGGIEVLEDGFIVIGDKIEVDPTAEQIIDQVKRMLWLIKIDKNTGNEITSRTFGTFSSLAILRKDIRGFAVTSNQNGTIYSSGTIRFQGTRAQAFVAEHNATTLDTLWSRKFDLENRDYINGKSVHVTEQNKIIWTTSATLDQANVSRSYLSIPVLMPASTFDNNQVFGRDEETSTSYYGSDIQPSPGGFSIIGTYRTLTGTNSNIFLLQTDKSGNIIPNSDRYYDGATTEISIPRDQKNTSLTDDEGSAIISSQDGGYLIGGSTTTTAEKGNGGTDIILIKTDLLGEVIWNKLIGGSGDESISAIRQTKDGGYILAGTLNLFDQKKMMIIKLNRDGELSK